jgi:uncharacterized protein with PIN domain
MPRHPALAQAGRPQLDQRVQITKRLMTRPATTAAAKSKPKREPLPVVEHRLPRCPRCSGSSLATRRTISEPGLEARRYVQCRDCGQNFWLLVIR